MLSINFYMKHFANFALDSAQNKPFLWPHYVDDKFAALPNGSEQLQNFLSHLNSSRTSSHFTMKKESGSAIPFLNDLVIRKEMALATIVFRKPTQTG
jgi:hypothetical protein